MVCSFAQQGYATESRKRYRDLSTLHLPMPERIGNLKGNQAYHKIRHKIPRSFKKNDFSELYSFDETRKRMVKRKSIMIGRRSDDVIFWLAFRKFCER